MLHALPRYRLAPLLLFGSAALAQSGGPTMVLAQGFSVDPGTSLPGFTAGSVIFTETGFDSAPPTLPPPLPGAVDFSSLPIPPGLDVDALSIGFDWVLSDPLGFVAIPPGNWGVLTWSVRRTTAGLPGSLIAAEAVTADGAAGDVFAYVLPGSAAPPEIVGIPYRAQDSTEVSVFTPGTPATLGNLDAHDLFVGLVYGENPQLAALLPPPTVFFSVTDATKAGIPAAWAALPLRSGATVFATTWLPATSSWSPPSVALTPAMLGLSAVEDLDGLALDLAHGRVLLSTDPALPPPLPTPPRNPLLYSTLYSGTNTTYKLPGGTPVATAIGLGGLPDDIDGICMLDPGGPGAPSQQRIDFMLGTRSNNILPTAPRTLEAVVARRLDRATNSERFRTFMTGWPPPGTPAPGFAVVGVTLGPPAAGPWITSGLWLRPNPLSPWFAFQGHPEQYEFHVPPSFSLIGAPLSFVWAAFAGSSFSLSHPVTILL